MTRFRLLRAALGLAAGLALAACSAVPVDHPPADSMKPGSGLFTGKKGQVEIPL
jgi:pectin methylesterase-like acyl-CoA thioesterase